MSELTLLIDAEHPWPGLMPFTEDAQAFFHGRDQEATEFLRLLKRATLTVLFGQSGLGKSSLLNAGIFPRLRADDYLPIYIRLDVSEAAPPFADQVKSAIGANCQAHQVDAPAAPAAATLWGWLHHRDTDFWSTRNRLLTPVLVFDQFEEIFTLGRHGEALEARCQEFLAELADLVEDRMPASLAAAIEGDASLGDGLDYSKHAWKVVFSFREDYLPDFEGLRSLIRPIMQNRMRLTRMSGEQARQSIAKAGGHLVRDEVAEQIIRFVAAPRGDRESSELARLEVEPALMSVVCRELNNRRLLAGAPEISADLLSAGAQQEIIHDYYEDCLRDIDARVRCFVEDHLLTDAGYRDSAALEDALLLPGIRRDAIDLLIGRRLLRLEERSGVLRVELTHDVLTRVAKASRDNRKDAERLRLQVEAEQTRRRRTRRLTLIVGSSLSVAIGLAVVFAVLLGRANEQRERLLVTQSSVMLSRANSALEQGVPGEPYAMLAEAIRLNPENRSALARSVALFAQRRQPLKLASSRLAGSADIGWLRAGGYLVAAGETARVALAPAAVDTLRLRTSANDYEDAGLVELSAAPRAGLDALPARAGAPALPTLAGSGVVPFVSRNFMLQLFDAIDRTPLAKPLQLGGRPRGLALSHNRQWLAAVSGDGRLTLARVDGSSIRQLVVDVDPDGDENPIAFVSDSGQAFVHGRDAGVLVGVSGAPLSIAHGKYPARLNPAAAQMAIARGRTVRLFDLGSGQAIGAAIDHPATVRDLSFSPDGKYLATASLDRQARVWKVATQTLAAPPMRHDGPVLAVRYGDNSQTLFTASGDGAARAWQPLRGELLAEPMLHGEAVVDLAAEPGGDHLLTLTAGHEVGLWRWRHGAQPQPLALALNGKISALAADAHGDRIAWGSGGGELALTVAVSRAGDPPRLLWQHAAAPATAVGALAFSDDGRQLAVARGGAVSLIDAASGSPSAIELRHERALTALRFSHDGRVLATTAADRSVRLWTVADGLPLGLRSAHRQAPSVAFSPDDRLLLVADAERVSLWDVASGQPRGELKTALGEGARLLLADFAGADAVVLVSENRVHRLPLVAGKTGERRLPASADDGVALALGDLRAWAASRSPDARMLALGGLDGRLRLVDLASLAPVGEPMRHDDAVLGLAWSADGRSVISWSRDRSVRVWGIDSGHLVADVIALDNEARFVQPAQGALAIADERGALWPLGSVPAGKVPGWLPTLLEETGGVRLDQGQLRRLEERSDVLGAVAAGSDEWSIWAATVGAKLRGPAPAGQGGNK